jgi:lauroyl/myristoyl acyltransferase
MAWRYEADVVVSGIRRVNESFRFELLVSQVIKHDEWQTKEDPVTFITERYTRGIERMILEDPTQYLWAYPRWGIDLAQQRLAQSAS